MKKLTWALLSLMLFFGMGTAFAQDGQGGDEPPAVTVPAPVFTPADGGEVAPGEAITFEVSREEGMTYMMVVFTYAFNDNDVDLQPSFEEVYAGMDPDMGGELACNVAVYNSGYFSPYKGIPVDAEVGSSITMRVRKAYAVMDENAPDEMPTLVYSEEVVANYTVKAGEAETIPVPEIDLESGEYPFATTVNFTVEASTNPAISHVVYWVLDSDFNFSDYADDEAVEDAGAKYLSSYKLVKGVTIKAATLKMDLMNDTYAWSEPVTATYTVSAPVAPTFDPVAGEVASGTKVSIKSADNPANGSAIVNIYYTTNGAAPTASSTKYTEPIEITADVTIKAIAVGVADNTLVSAPAEAAYTVVAVVAPTFNPNGGEVEASTGIALTASPASAKIYYAKDATEATFTAITTETALQDAIDNDEITEYSNAAKPALEDFGVEDPGAKLSLSAAAVLIGEDGSLTWSDVTTKEFTVAGGEEPVAEVAKPTITPANDANVHIGDEVTIECTTEGAEIYYTTDGTAPYTTDASGENITGVKEDAIKYTEPFELTEDMLIEMGETYALKIRAIAVKGEAFSTGASAGYSVYPNAPEFYPVAGEVAFGTEVEIEYTPSQAKIYYTTDGTEPTIESKELDRWESILLTKDMTIKAIAVLGQYNSTVATAAYTVNPVENARLTLSPMNEDTVGQNVGTGIAFTDGTPESEDWVRRIPAFVYYTVDGTTVPSKAAYEAQADKENGAIKMLAVKWEEQWGSYGPVADAEGNLMSITFTEATRLKAIGYLVEGNDVLVTTALLDTMLQIKSEAIAEFEPVSGTEVELGETIVIENPHYYAEFDMEMPEWPGFDATEEENAAYEEAMEAYNEAQAAYNAEIGQLPQTEMYFSFDGTKPTVNNRYADDNESVFSTREGGNVEITFGKDEEGYYAYVPEILGYNSPADTIRLEDGKLSVEVLCVTTVVEEGGDGPMPLSAKWGMPGGAAPFKYGSDFATAEYTIAVKPELPETVEAPVFVPAAGEVEKGTEVTWTWNEEYDYDVMGVVYVANGKDEDLNIDAAKFEELVAAWGEEEEDLVREDGKVYLYYEGEGAYKIEKNATLKARLVLGIIQEVEEGQEGENPGMEIKLSSVVTAAYTIKGETPATTVAKPTFSPAAGEVEKGTKVTIACETEGAVIYYTVDGTEPTAESTEYKEAIEINEAMTIKAIAIKGDAKSEVATAAYTVKTANEDLELAGVSVYPNPSNGLFNLELPVAATVDVFMSNGMLYQRLTLAQGSTTLNIERSGVYFLRITGEGRTTVKRLIIR